MLLRTVNRWPLPRDSDSTEPVGAHHLLLEKIPRSDSNVQPVLEPWLLTEE